MFLSVDGEGAAQVYVGLNATVIGDGFAWFDKDGVLGEAVGPKRWCRLDDFTSARLQETINPGYWWTRLSNEG